jgi:hypothetical protein
VDSNQREQGVLRPALTSTEKSAPSAA